MLKVTVALALWVATVGVSAAGCAESTREACAGEDCSGHGTCQRLGASVWCECDEGYRPRGLSCVPRGSDADADADVDTDAETDVDTDADADADTETDAETDADPDADPDIPPDLTREDSFDDFADGTFPGSLANLYVSADGAVRSIHATDVTGDDAPDLVVANNFSGVSFEVPSYIYAGPFGSGESHVAPVHRLDTVGAAGAAVADLDADGALDVIFANVGYELPGGYDVGSFIFRGPDFEPDSVETLSTTAANDAVVADLDRDGYLDVALTNAFHHDLCGRSVIHWGGATGFTRTSTFETICANGLAVADLDGDGHLDLVAANAMERLVDGSDVFDPPSFIYWGDGTRSGFREDPEHRTELETFNASDVTVADLDSDGRLDLVFGQNRPRPGQEPDSHADIYWGEGGRAFSGPTGLTGTGINVVSVADMDLNGTLDVVVANYFHPTFNGDSFIYWGEGRRDGWGTRTALRTVGARGVFVADFNLDEFPDVYFSSFQNGAAGEAGRHIDSYLYFGPDFLEEERAAVATVSARESLRHDLGNTYDRGPLETYVSSVMELARPPEQLWWAAETPADTSIRFQLRSGATAGEAERAPWMGPTSASDWYQTPGTPVNPAHESHRFVQYRAQFDLGGHLAVVVLDWVGM